MNGMVIYSSVLMFTLMFYWCTSFFFLPSSSFFILLHYFSFLGSTAIACDLAWDPPDNYGQPILMYEVEYREEHKYGEPEEWEKQATQPTDIGERREERRRRRSIHTVVSCVCCVCAACVCCVYCELCTIANPNVFLPCWLNIPTYLFWFDHRVYGCGSRSGYILLLSCACSECRRLGALLRHVHRGQNRRRALFSRYLYTLYTPLFTLYTPFTPIYTRYTYIWHHIYTENTPLNTS